MRGELGCTFSVDLFLSDGDAVPNGVFGSFDGSIGWGLYGDAAGEPGTLLASGTANPPREVFLVGGTNVVGDYARILIDFGSPTSLAPGTYWLAIREGVWGTAGSDPTELWWLISEVQGSPRCTSTQLATPGNWDCGVALDLGVNLFEWVLFASGFEAGATCGWSGVVGGGPCSPGVN